MVNELLVGLLISCLATVLGKVEFELKYYSYQHMLNILQELNVEYSHMTHLYSIGKSVLGRDIWVIAIANENPNKHVEGRPEVKLVANMHGNEPVGKELLLYFAIHLLRNYGTDSTITKILNTTRIHLLPTMNPDGFENSFKSCVGFGGRTNANSVDLNRNFPDQFNVQKKPIQPEVLAIMSWMDEIPFILSANFHGGAMVASYPYDNYPGNGEKYLPKYSPSPDDETFKYLALTYAKNHLIMSRPNPCPNKVDRFKNGITNGAKWYPISGGMQDYNYVQYGCMEITLEISCCKYPEEELLPTMWNANLKSMIEYIKQAHLGIKGIVRNAFQPLPKAKLSLLNTQIVFYTTKDGEFWKILLPGTYVLQVSADGYNPISQNITVPSVEAGPVILNIILMPILKATLRSLFGDLVSSMVPSNVIVDNTLLLTKTDDDKPISINSNIEKSENSNGRHTPIIWVMVTTLSIKMSFGLLTTT